MARRGRVMRESWSRYSQGRQRFYNEMTGPQGPNGARTTTVGMARARELAKILDIELAPPEQNLDFPDRYANSELEHGLVFQGKVDENGVYVVNRDAITQEAKDELAQIALLGDVKTPILLDFGVNVDNNTEFARSWRFSDGEDVMDMMELPDYPQEDRIVIEQKQDAPPATSVDDQIRLELEKQNNLSENYLSGVTDEQRKDTLHWLRPEDYESVSDIPGSDTYLDHTVDILSRGLEGNEGGTNTFIGSVVTWEEINNGNATLIPTFWDGKAYDITKEDQRQQVIGFVTAAMNGGVVYPTSDKLGTVVKMTPEGEPTEIRRDIEEVRRWEDKLHTLIESPIDIYSYITGLEDVIPQSYKDSEGYLTGGIGHLLTPEEQKQYPEGTKIPDSVIDQWFTEDVDKASKAAVKQLKELGLDPARKREFLKVLTSVNFQLGVNWNKEHDQTWGFMKQSLWELAANEVEQSLWKKQTRSRAVLFQDALKELNEDPLL